MKSKLTIILVLFSSFLFSQSNKMFVDAQQTYNEAIEEYNKSNVSNSIELLDQINENDSIYQEAMTTKSSILLNNKMHAETIELCNRMIQLKKENTSTFYINKGVAYLREKDNSSAIETFKEALKNYPMNFLINYNLGVCYEGVHQMEEAILCYQKSIILNPYYAPPHLQLGNICYAENLITEAVLCWNMYLILNPTSDYSLNVLVLINNAVSEKNKNSPTGLKISVDDKNFEEIDLVVNNYAAIDKAYKITTKIDVAMVKQNHAIMTLLNDFEGEGSFWSEKYVPFFKGIMKNGYFDAFIYQIMSSTTIEKYQKIIGKNTSAIAEFKDWAYRTWSEICSENNKDIMNADVNKFFYRSSGRLQSIGENNSEGNPEGSYLFYNDDGSLLSSGFFIDGKRNKKWVWYHTDGSIDQIANYTNDLFSGEYVEYFDNGNKKIQANHKNGYYDKLVLKYSIYGALIESSNYNEGNLEGKQITNHALGEGFKKYEILYHNNNIDSIASEFYPNGKVKLIMEYKQGVPLSEKGYYLNGQLNYQYSFENGVTSGNYEEYSNNGKIQIRGKFLKGKKTGNWKTFSEDGILIEDENYNENGEFTGIHRIFSIEGNLYAEFEYKNGDMIAYKYFNPEHEILVQAKKENKKFNFEGYHPNGTPSSTGVYRIDGKKEGIWLYYDEYGCLTSKENYSDGLINDYDEEYFRNGSLSIRTAYKDGNQNGYFVSYYPDSTLHQEGFNVNGLLKGEVLTYYADGTIQEKVYYKNNVVEGFSYTYTIDGKLSEKHYYENGLLHYIEYYDSTAKVNDKLDLFNTKNKKTLYPNGNTLSESNYLNGYIHGPFVYYHFNGKKAYEGEYFMGNKNGVWKIYDENENLVDETNYEFGSIQGISTSYYPDGSISSSENYLDNELHGWNINFSEKGDTTYKAFYTHGLKNSPCHYYSDLGELQLIRYYHYDELIGYAYLNNEGKVIEMIPLPKGTGKVISYFQNGKKAREIEFLNGTFNGSYKQYHSNGTLAETTEYLCDVHQGKHTEYYPNKQLKEESYFKNGVLNGPYLNFYPNGQISKQMKFINGGISGEASYFNESGKMTKKEFYYNNYMIHAENYH
ncbi:MAG: hypothetical protein ACERKD_13480 [Prolixibacteraceae bacterium]